MSTSGEPFDPVPNDPRRSAGGPARLRNYFLTGLVIAAPVGITLWIIWTFVSWVDSRIKPLIPARYSPETYLPFPLPGFGLVVALFALTLLGFLTANLVGRRLVTAGEALLGRMPIVRPLYRGLKQVFETLFSQSGSSFRKVAMVEFPSPGMWSLVFLSSPPGSQVTSRLPSDEDYVSAFLPCTPNPTTGFFFYVPRSEVIELDITVETAAKLIMSAGLIQPDIEDPAVRMQALAATARAAQAARKKAAGE
jgi:uncharacterized membrane protein